MAAVTGAGLAATLAAGPALTQPTRAQITGAQQPAARLAPGAVVADGTADLFYTAADGSVGTDDQVYEDIGSWVPSSAPGFTGWIKVTG